MSHPGRRAFLRLAMLGAGACVLRRVPPTAEAQTPTSDWLVGWEEVLAAARLEGRLSLISVVGRGYQAAIDAFQQTFPGFEVEHLAESTSSIWLEQARANGPRRFDLALVSPEAALSEDLLWVGPEVARRNSVVRPAHWRGAFVRGKRRAQSWNRRAPSSAHRSATHV